MADKPKGAAANDNGLKQLENKFDEFLQHVKSALKDVGQTMAGLRTENEALKKEKAETEAKHHEDTETATRLSQKIDNGKQETDAMLKGIVGTIAGLILLGAVSYIAVTATERYHGVHQRSAAVSPPAPLVDTSNLATKSEMTAAINSAKTELAQTVTTQVAAAKTELQQNITAVSSAHDQLKLALEAYPKRAEVLAGTKVVDDRLDKVETDLQATDKIAKDVAEQHADLNTRFAVFKASVTGGNVPMPPPRPTTTAADPFPAPAGSEQPGVELGGDEPNGAARMVAYNDRRVQGNRYGGACQQGFQRRMVAGSVVCSKTDVVDGHPRYDEAAPCQPGTPRTKVVQEGRYTYTIKQSCKVGTL